MPEWEQPRRQRRPGDEGKPSGFSLINLPTVDRPAFHLVLIKTLVEVESFEQELDHRRAHLGPVGQAQLLQRRRELGHLTDRARVGASRDALADLEHRAVLESRHEPVEMRGGEVAAEHRADSATLEARKNLLLLALV